MPLYHFNYGNSGCGPIGYCAKIRADTPEAAARRLKEQLCSVLGDFNDVVLSPDDQENGEYLEVYFNPDFVSVKGIDE